MKRNRVTLWVLGFFILEAVLFGFVDRPVSEYLRGVDAQQPDIINFFRAYTDIGKSKDWLILSGVGIIICAVAMRLPSLRSELRTAYFRIGEGWLFFFASIALSGIAADIIKPILGRARPVMLEREGLYGFHPFSFHATFNGMPSGHATTAFAMACALSFLVPRWRILWFAFAVAIAVSRIMVNAHYLSDVCTGAVVGIVTVAVLRATINHNVIRHMIYSIFPIDRQKPLR